MTEFTIGQKVLYHGAWGTNLPRPCTITGQGIEAGRVVYDNSLGKWGYAYQYQPLTNGDHVNGTDHTDNDTSATP